MRHLENKSSQAILTWIWLIHYKKKPCYMTLGLCICLSSKMIVLPSFSFSKWLQWIKGDQKNWKPFSCWSSGVLRPAADKFWNVKNVTLNGYDIFSGIDAHRYNLPQGSSQSCYTRGIHPGRRWISHRSGISDFLGLRHRKSSISSTVSLSLFLTFLYQKQA